MWIFYGTRTPSGLVLLHCRAFSITLRYSTISRTPLDDWPGRRKDPYLTTHNKQKRETFSPLRNSNPQSQFVNGRRPTP